MRNRVSVFHSDGSLLLFIVEIVATAYEDDNQKKRVHNLH